MSESNSLPRAVVALAGARDYYQLPLALCEAGLLQKLVTDVYWPADRAWFRSSIGAFLPEKIIASRFCAGLSSEKVEISGGALSAFALMKMVPSWNLNRIKDRNLARRARRLALRDDAALFCYNYYASEAFLDRPDRPRYRFLFQIQASPDVARQILLEEIERTPAAHASLAAEYEILLPQEQLQALRDEPHLANGWVTTCGFAADSLVKSGISSDAIRIVPYGVDSTVFIKRPSAPDPRKAFKIIYVGSLIQRKGISYLLEAARLLKSSNIRLVFCVRGFIDRNLLAEYSDIAIEIKVGLSGRQLAYELHSSDVFVFPSLSEGFGHVILETMACGVPVIATPHTCAPDVMVDGKHGFIVPIRDSEAIAEKLAWGIDHRAELAAMGELAAEQARHFTWRRFRDGVRDAYGQMIAAVG